MKKVKGFTLVEMLVVLVLIGILAAIAMPRLMESKKKAVKLSMMSDIRNFITAMGIFSVENGRPSLKADFSNIPYTLSKNNTLLMSEYSGVEGWHIEVTNSGYTDSIDPDKYFCSYFIGQGTSAGANIAFADAGGSHSPSFPFLAIGSKEGVISCIGF